MATLSAVLDGGRPLDEAFDAAASRIGTLEPRDRALARLIVLTVLRRKGELQAVVNSFLEKPLPASTGALWPILLSAAAQLLVLDTPPHAAISLAVDQCRDDRKARRFDRLANAVLRRVASQGKEVLATLDPVKVNVPSWLRERWGAAYGGPLAREIAAASLREAPLDLSVKSDPSAWAGRLGGLALPTGTVRLARTGRVEDLAGFSDGAWWVQDAAAALPARLLGDVSGLRVADLCAAPGGKTAELAAAGAEVTAVDHKTMLAEGRHLAKIAPNVAVKVPLTWAGLRACKTLSDEGFMVNVTLCFSANQALVAAKAGATFISPFIGRLDDINLDGMDLIGDIRTIYDNYGFSTQILAASVRTVNHVTQAALVGADVMTAPPSVIKALAAHPLTDRGLEQFMADWARTGQKIL